MWEWYAWRRETIAACAPNAAHAVIADWSAGVRPRYDPSSGSDPGTERLRVGVVTQNVDDLHVRAGTQSLFGCTVPSGSFRAGIECANGSTPWRDERVPLPELPPRCSHCGGLARPAVVWFGETLRAEAVDAAAEATACDVFLTVGTSAVVYPAAGLVHQARHQGAFTARDQHRGDSGLLSCRHRAPWTCRADPAGAERRDGLAQLLTPDRNSTLDSNRGWRWRAT